MPKIPGLLALNFGICKIGQDSGSRDCNPYTIHHTKDQDSCCQSKTLQKRTLILLLLFTWAVCAKKNPLNGTNEAVGTVAQFRYPIAMTDDGTTLYRLGKTITSSEQQPF